MKKRALTLLLACMMLLAWIPCTAYAATKPEIAPLWDNIGNMNVILGFDGETGLVSGYMARQSGTTSADGTVTVYHYVDGDWEYVISFYKSTTRISLVIDDEFDAASGEIYKAVFVGTVYRDTVGETETTEHIARCP